METALGDACGKHLIILCIFFLHECIVFVPYLSLEKRNLLLMTPQLFFSSYHRLPLMKKQLAKNPDSIVPMPILLSHRAPGVPYPANIIELTESTVIMATERKLGETGPGTKIDSTEREKQKVGTPVEEEWNKHCFQIVHTQHKGNIPTPKTTTRIFTAPLVERNEWVFAMNSALIAYVKHLGRTRRNEAAKQGAEYDKSILGDEADDEKREQPRKQPTRSISPFVNDLMGLPPNHPIRPVQSWDT